MAESASIILAVQYYLALHNGKTWLVTASTFSFTTKIGVLQRMYIVRLEQLMVQIINLRTHNLL